MKEQKSGKKFNFSFKYFLFNQRWKFEFEFTFEFTYEGRQVFWRKRKAIVSLLNYSWVKRTLLKWRNLENLKRLNGKERTGSILGRGDCFERKGLRLKEKRRKERLFMSSLGCAAPLVMGMIGRARSWQKVTEALTKTGTDSGPAWAPQGPCGHMHVGQSWSRAHFWLEPSSFWRGPSAQIPVFP